MDVVTTQASKSVTGSVKQSAKQLTKHLDLSGVSTKTAHSYAMALIRANQQTKSLAPPIRTLDNATNRKLVEKSIKSVDRRYRRHKLWPLHNGATRRKHCAQLVELAQTQLVRLLVSAIAYWQASSSDFSATLETDQFQALRPYRKILAPVIRAYAAIKGDEGFIDFGDMLARATALIADGHCVVNHTHILVDEYQDCSAAQIQLLVALARLPQCSLMVFGDPQQAIYGFAGSRYTPLSSVLRKTVVMPLPISRRLTAPIAALASALVSKKGNAAIKTTRDGVKPKLQVNRNLKHQTASVVADIQRLIEIGVSPSQIAVLGRVKAVLHPVEQALLAVGVNTTRLGTTRHRRSALAVLRLVRMVERHAAGPALTLDLLQAHVRDNERRAPAKWAAALREIKRVGRLPSLESRYRACGDIYLRLKGGIRADPELRQDINRWEPFCRKFDDARQMRAAVIALPSENLVTGTVHAAKGMEWSYVLVVGLADGQFPSYLAKDDKAIEEESRVLYVAVTRAKTAVRLYYAPVAHARSRNKFETLSRFLAAAMFERRYGMVEG